MSERMSLNTAMVIRQVVFNHHVSPGVLDWLVTKGYAERDDTGTVRVIDAAGKESAQRIGSSANWNMQCPCPFCRQARKENQREK